MKTSGNLVSLAVAALCMASMQAAQADILDLARSALGDMMQGRAPKQTPATPPAANRGDGWGDGEIVPRRGRALEGMTAAQQVDERMIDDRYGLRERVLVPPTRARSANSVREAPDRETELRQALERGPFNEAPPASREATGRSSSERSSSTRSTARRASEERLFSERSLDRPTDRRSRNRAQQDRDFDDLISGSRMVGAGDFGERSGRSATPVRASCTNVSRAWEGAANFAELGQTDRAYGAYMRLLSSCRTERELVGTIYQAIRHLPSDALYNLLDEPIMGSAALQGPAYELRSNMLYRLNREGKSNEALRLAEEMREQALERKDANILSINGYLELQSKRPDRAIELFRAALRSNREHEKSREGLALALLAGGKPDAAWREADRLTSDNADAVRATVRVAQARLAYQSEDHKDALRLLSDAERLGHEMSEADLALKAWSLKGAGQADKSARLFAQLNRTAPDNREYATGLVEAYRSGGQFDKIEKLADSVSVAAPIAQAAIADQYLAQGRLEEASVLLGTPVEGGKSPSAAGTIAVKAKSGVAGAGRLTIVSTPEMTVTAQVGKLGRLVAQIGSLRLSDGANDVTAREGRIGISTQGQIAVTAGLTLSTVLGNNLPGGDLTIRRFNAGGYNEISINRGPVYDSVRSYAGVTDPDGFSYGRVDQVAVSFAGVQSLNANWKADYAVTIGSLSGRNVNTNGFFRTSVGGIRSLADFGLPWISAGPQAHMASYKEDQNIFRGPVGGYFSPKSDVGFGLKAYLAASPSDRLIVRGNSYAGYANRSFIDFSESGLQLEGDLSASYLLNENLIASAGTTLRTSPGYSDAAFWISLLVPFEKRTTLNARDLIRPSIGIR